MARHLETGRRQRGLVDLRLLLLDRPLDDALLEESVRLKAAAYGGRATSNE